MTTTGDLPAGTVTFLFTTSRAGPGCSRSWGPLPGGAGRARGDPAPGHRRRRGRGQHRGRLTWRRAGACFDLGNGLVWLAVVYARAGRPADARPAMREALELFREADSPHGHRRLAEGRAPSDDAMALAIGVT